MDERKAEPEKELGSCNVGAMPPESSVPYTVFTTAKCLLILGLASFSASFSPLSSFIFFPAIDDIAHALDVSVGRINLTITSYMIVAGLAPAVLGDLADKVGRRMVYILMMTIYCAANVGLALQNDWSALFVLRMVQSAGSAATIAVGYGVVSDIAPPALRGSFVSVMVLGPNIATAVGPVIGGALTGYLSWRWIFWLPAILSGVCLLLVVLLLPETARSIVGDGTGHVSGLRRTVLSYFRQLVSPSPHSHSVDPTADPIPARHGDQHARSLNPFHSLRLLWAKDTISITLVFGIFYMNLSALQASTSTLFAKVYRLDGIQLGLIYLPSGIGSCIGAYGAGTLLDYDYRIVAEKYNLDLDGERCHDVTFFPIEKARFRSIWYVIGTGTISLIAYGWCIHAGVTMAVPLLFHFLIGLSTAIVFNMCGTLLVDIHPKLPSSAQAANSIVRAFLAGGSTGLVQVLIDGIGSGWTFTVLGGLGLGCLLLAWLEWRYGRIWRDKIREQGTER